MAGMVIGAISLIVGILYFISMIIFKVSSAANSAMGTHQINKDIKATQRNMQQQMESFNNKANFYYNQNEKARQKALEEAERVKIKNQRYEDEISTALKKNLVVLQYKYPNANGDLFLEYSKQFFMNDADALKNLENQMMISNQQNS